MTHHRHQSFDEVVEAIARRRKVERPTAGLLAAEIYGLVEAEPDPTLEAVRLDEREMPDYEPLFDFPRPMPVGRPIPIDSPRSPQGQIAAQIARMQAKEEGDYYRRLSRRTSFHDPADLG